MESEKLTLNIGAIDLGQIDLLVDQGFYSSRTDFIRTAIRSKLAEHSEEINNIKSSSIFGVELLEDEHRKVDTEIGKADEIEKVRKVEKIEEIDRVDKVNKLAAGLDTKFAGTGVFGFSRKALEEINAAGKKIELSMVGMLIIDKDVTPELAAQTFGKVRVYGMIKAPEAVRQILLGLR